MHDNEKNLFNSTIIVLVSAYFERSNEEGSVVQKYCKLSEENINDKIKSDLI